MGGKSGPAPPDAMSPDADMAAMMQMMSSMGSMPAFQAPVAPIVPEAPELRRTPEVDWTTRHEELGAKAKADYKNDQARKKGRSSTVHTSPLLDEEEDETKSIASGG